MAVEYLGTGNDDGMNIGRSATDKLGFYGLTTPIVQPTITAVGTTTMTTTLLETKINRLYAALESLNIVATSS